METYQYFLGIDISKNNFDFCLLNNISNTPVEKQKLQMNKQGFEKLIKLISNHIKSNDDLFITMEATGTYHLTLLNFLVKRNYQVALANPKLVNSYSNSISLRNTTTDSIASKHIARFAKDRYKDLDAVDKDSITSLKTLNRERESFSEAITKVKTKIKNLLNRLFPELEHITNLFSKTITKLLCQAPSAEKISQKGLEFIKKHINDTNGSKINTSAKTIFKAAQNSTGIKDQYLETVLLAELKRLNTLKKEMKNIEQAIKNAISTNEQIKTNSELITSIKGIGEKTAIPFLIETGILGANIKNIFPSYKQLIAYTGTDPSLKQSGSSINHQGSISKKGNKYLRKTVYLMAQNTIRYEGYFKYYFKKKIEEGKTRNQAIIAVANKLIKIIYTLLKNKTKYDSEYHLKQVNWIA
ncbi:IS110 family transposase [Halanaerobacter jeridensis]|uniref:Transposase n=1 Tax=Halanaerobacter jeridensis TaxID=706427 RepID=A0A939BSD0_9FIRM|nr:IS110 family transposase [Halanaerobacter jeridensis]MBM7558234.1 transposase [Halanaerobacter jeridensis]